MAVLSSTSWSGHVWNLTLCHSSQFAGVNVRGLGNGSPKVPASSLSIDIQRARSPMAETLTVTSAAGAGARDSFTR